MLNLILNAVELMSGMSEGSRDLLISSEDGGGRARVAGQDLPGTEPQSENRLFQAFYTTKPTAWDGPDYLPFHHRGARRTAAGCPE